MLENLFNEFEELKKYVYIINRGSNEKPIIITFNDENFFHLVGLHKINMLQFVPHYIKTKARLYKFMKKNIKKYNGILMNQIGDQHNLNNRISTFSNILSLLKDNKDISLYNLKNTPPGSLYKGDYGLLRLYENINCLLCLKITEETTDYIKCVPQSWMASTQSNRLVEFKKPIYMQSISAIRKEIYDNGIQFV